MRKKIKLTIVVLCISMLSTCATTFASTNDVPTYDTYAINYSSASASISVSGNRATSSGKIWGISGKTTKTSIHLYLQKYANGVWVNVDDWTSSGNTVNRTISKTKNISKGYKYRSKAICYAYAGTKSEKVTKYSRVISY